MGRAGHQGRPTHRYEERPRSGGTFLLGWSVLDLRGWHLPLECDGAVLGERDLLDRIHLSFQSSYWSYFFVSMMFPPRMNRSAGRSSKPPIATALRGSLFLYAHCLFPSIRHPGQWAATAIPIGPPVTRRLLDFRWKWHRRLV